MTTIPEQPRPMVYPKRGRQQKAVNLEKATFSGGEVAGICGVCTRLAARWCDEGQIKSHRLPGRLRPRRVYRDDLIRFMRANGFRLPPVWEVRRIVAVLVPGHHGADAVSPTAAGALAARGDLAGVLVGTADGLAAAAAAARDLAAIDPALTLGLLLPADVPQASVPVGQFTHVFPAETSALAALELLLAAARGA